MCTEPNQTNVKKLNFFFIFCIYSLRFLDLLAFKYTHFCVVNVQIPRVHRIGKRREDNLDLFWLDSSVTKIAKKFPPLATDFKVLTTRCSEIEVFLDTSLCFVAFASCQYLGHALKLYLPFFYPAV